MISIEFLRQFRIFGYAIFDFVLTFVGVIVLYPLLKKVAQAVGLRIPLNGWLFLSVPLSIVAHILSGNFTPLTQQFLRTDGDYLVKIVILGLLIAGIRTVSKTKK